VLGNTRLKLKDPKLREQILAEAEGQRPPKQLMTGDKIYSGTWRSFSQQFTQEWWNSQMKPWTCCICKLEIHPQDRSIDHKEPWARIRTEIATIVVCCRGVHWRVTLTDAVRAKLQDESNLRPVHKSCNSRKNGPKDMDSIAPQRRENCPNPGHCQIQKAE
jgi:hypothetical protein